MPWPSRRSLPGAVTNVQWWHVSRHSRVSGMKTLREYDDLWTTGCLQSGVTDAGGRQGIR
jgi:hypothetical protein